MRLIVFLFVCSFGSTLNGQADTKVLNALKKQNFSLLDEYFDSNVELSLNNSREIVSRSEAKAALVAFLENGGYSDFNILHDGKSENKKSSYKVAKFTKGGKRFRIFAYAEQVDGKSFVTEIHITEI